MSALATRIERAAGRRLTPTEIFNISAARETTLSRLLILYIGTGLAFMLLPGTALPTTFVAEMGESAVRI